MLNPKPKPQNLIPVVLSPRSRPILEAPAHLHKAKAHSIDTGEGGGGGGKGSEPERLALSNITYQEVEKSYELLSPQLSVTGDIKTIRKNIFCRIRLYPNGNQNPPEIFGRVVSCYPSPTNIEHARLIEIHFPREFKSPAFVRINGSDIDTSSHALVETALIKVPIWGDADDFSMFEGYESQFREKGFEPVDHRDPTDLIDASGTIQEKIWIYVIGSGWLEKQASTDISVYKAVKATLGSSVKNANRIIINLHTPDQTMILNEILEIIPQLNPYSFYDAWNFTKVLEIVEKGFNKLFSLPLKNTMQ